MLILTRLSTIGPRRHITAYGVLVALALGAFVALVGGGRARYINAPSSDLGEAIGSQTWIIAAVIAVGLMTARRTYAAGLWIGAAVLTIWGALALSLGLQYQVSLAGPTFALVLGLVAAQTAREADRRQGGRE